MLLVDAYINAERIEDVKKGMVSIERVLNEAGQKKDILFHLACGRVRCGEYESALATVDKCLVIVGGFWKAVALREIITTALSSQESRMSRLRYGALTAIAVAAGGVAWMWSSPKMKMLRTMSRMSGLRYGSLTAIAVAARGVAWMWSSPKMKMLRTMTLPKWKEASDLVDKIENRMVQNMPMGAGFGAVSCWDTSCGLLRACTLGGVCIMNGVLALLKSDEISTKLQ
ncbi:mitochondrial fission 1 protein A [Tanacetum coccineum]